MVDFTAGRQVGVRKCQGEFRARQELEAFAPLDCGHEVDGIPAERNGLGVLAAWQSRGCSIPQTMFMVASRSVLRSASPIQPFSANARCAPLRRAQSCQMALEKLKLLANPETFHWHRD